MDTSLPQATLTCTQCGGELHPDEGQIFLTCPFCSSSVYVDKSRVVFHWYVAPTLNEAQAQAALRRWMASSQTVKDLDQKSRVTETSFEYFPVWYFKRRDTDGKEEVQLMPAAATAVSELRQLRLPAGDLRKYTSDIDSQAHMPTVPLEAALNWLSTGADASDAKVHPAALRGPNTPGLMPNRIAAVDRRQVAEQSLVHIPLYSFKYLFNGQTYTAIVEGATGGVFANIFPAKAEAPYVAVGLVTALIFLCLAVFPVAGGVTNGAEGVGIGFAVCAAVGLVVAPLLFALAAWVAAKV